MYSNDTNRELVYKLVYDNPPIGIPANKSGIRPIYYYKESEVPKKYKDINQYDFDEFKIPGIKHPKLILFDLKTGEPVIKNKARAFKPKLLPINGQELHELTMPDWKRAKVMNILKAFFLEGLNGLAPIDHTILVEMYWHDRAGNFDMDNKSLFYIKAFLDTIKGVLVKDDTVHYIAGSPPFIFVNSEKRILEILIFKDLRNMGNITDPLLEEEEKELEEAFNPEELEEPEDIPADETFDLDDAGADDEEDDDEF